MIVSSPQEEGPGKVRQFSTGATRDSDGDKLDYEGFIDPFTLEVYAQYMHRHRVQPDGNLRDSDNWQKGIPTSVYMKSLLRHVFELWRAHRRGAVDQAAVLDACCGILFNTFGYIHENLKAATTGMDTRRTDNLT